MPRVMSIISENTIRVEVPTEGGSNLVYLNFIFNLRFGDFEYKSWAVEVDNADLNKNISLTIEFFENVAEVLDSLNSRFVMSGGLLRETVRNTHNIFPVEIH